MARSKFPRGGFVDDSVPDLTEYKAHLPEGFEAWLGNALGIYRDMYGGKPENKGDNVAALREVIQLCETLLAFDVETIPPSAEAFITEAAYRAYGNHAISDFLALKSLRREAFRAKDVCVDALEKIEALPAKTGRPSNLAADRLFVRVTDKLVGEDAGRRLVVAVEILALCGVPTPETENVDSLERAYKRAKAAMRKAGIGVTDLGGAED